MKYIPGLVLLFIIFQSHLVVLAQGTYSPIHNDNIFHFVDRLEMKSDSIFQSIHSSHKSYERKAISDLVSDLQLQGLFFKGMDRHQHSYLLKESNEWNDMGKIYSKWKPFKKGYFSDIYHYKTDFLFLQDEDFFVKVNPVLHFEVGSNLGNPNDSSYLFVNTRGLEVRGKVGNKIGFYSFLSENQARHPDYVRNYIFDEYKSLPGENRFKPFRNGGVDYFSATGYITYQANKYVNLQFGHDKNFIGNGIRSLILSDFSGNYLFLKMKTNIWKLEYTNIFTQIIGQVKSNDDNVFGYLDGQRNRKYTALHHLSLNLSKRLNIGVFENIVFGRQNGYELEYLNPVIFYRAIENQLGGSDNVLLGFDFKWLPINKLQLYGQFILDEWNFEAITSQNGDWKNKNAFQLGMKTIDLFGVSALDFQLEFNQARPYTYSHDDTISNYTHYNQSMAHPLGANFRELLGTVKYQMKKNLQFVATMMYAQYGLDEDSINYGGNIFSDYSSNRPDDLNNKIAQGNTTDVLLLNLTASWQAKHNLFIDLNYRFRDSSDENGNDLNSQYIGTALRLNIGRRGYQF